MFCINKVLSVGEKIREQIVFGILVILDSQPILTLCGYLIIVYTFAYVSPIRILLLLYSIPPNWS